MMRFLALLLLSLTATTSRAEVLTTEDSEAFELASPDDSTDLQAEINKFRRKRLLPELTINPGLACSAALHASDIGPKQRCSGIGSDGSTLKQRLTLCQVPMAIGAAEVIACGHLDAYQAVIGLLGGPRTSAVLLDPKMRQFGLDQVNKYWVVVLSP